MFLYKTCRRKHPPTKWILKGKQVLFSRLDCQACLWLCQEGTMLQFWKLLKVFSDNLNRQLMRVIIFCIGECKKKKRNENLTGIPQSVSVRPHQGGEKPALMCGYCWRRCFEMWLNGLEGGTSSCRICCFRGVKLFPLSWKNQHFGAAVCGLWQMSYPLLAYVTCNMREFFSDVI